MVSNDLHEVLTILYEAGASRVPADEIDWTSEMAPAINYALTMQYVIHRETRGGRLFSLTEAGYSAIGREAPSHMSIARTLKSLFRIGGGSAE